MRTIASLIVLVAMAAPAVAPAQSAGSGPTLLAQAEATEEDSTAPADEADEASPEEDEPAQPEADEAAPPEEDDAEGAPEEEAQQQPGDEATDTEPSDEVAETEPAEEGAILRSRAAMPEPVRETWRALVAAARSGDIERLRPILDDQPEPPMVAFDEVADPIAYLRSLSGDPEGREVLAILLEVLEAGFLHVDQGTPQEMFLWPYFARHPIDELTPQQMVELFTLLTAGDYQDMLSYGAYIFFRVGIAPDGRWLFFVAGD